MIFIKKKPMSFDERRQTIVNAFAEAMARVSKQSGGKKIRSVTSAENELRVSSGPGRHCDRCVAEKWGDCGDLCGSSVSGVQMDNRIARSFGAELSSGSQKDADVEQIVGDIKKSLVEKYGTTDTSDKLDTRLSEFVTAVVQTMDQNVDQFLGSRAGIRLNGPGVRARNLSTNVVAAATLQAIAQVCKKSEEECGVSQLDAVVQSMVDDVTSNVTRGVVSSTMDIWSRVKWDVYTMLGYLAVVLLLYLGLIVTKAVRPRGLSS